MTEAVEVSAGGLVLDGGRVLMVKVRNLQGRVIWTFPKGHLENAETPEEAAVREVREETGWQCRVEKPLGEAHYRFQRNEQTVSKTVHWFLMSPGGKTGTFDPEEVLECRWADRAEAESSVVYPSDRELMQRLKKTEGPA